MITHGVLMEVSGCGVLITGPAGSGKSQLGLELLDRGHRFVADDAIHLRVENESLIGCGVEECAEFLALRCGVVIKIERQFGAEQRLDQTPIDLIVSPGPALAPFAPSPRTELLGVSVPQHYLQTLPGSALSVEALARMLLDRRDGYSAAEELAGRQAARLRD